MNEPAVSIITAYYNRENFVEDSIRSILDQSFENWELLVFDDRSTDATYDRLKKIAAEDARIKLEQNATNLGFTKSMNLHLRRARGRYIAVHGSGDISHPDRIQKQFDFLEANRDVTVVSCKTEMIDRNGRCVSLDKGTGRISHDNLFVENRFFHGEVMYRRDLFEQLGGYREIFRVAADYDLWLRMSQHGDGYILPDYLYTLNSPSDGLKLKIKNRVDQKIVVGYSRHLVREGLGALSLEELRTLDLSADRQLRSDLLNVLKTAIKRKQFDAVKYAAKKFREIFGENIFIATAQDWLGSKGTATS